MTELFTEMAPDIVADLMIDFDINETDAAAIVGNLGHESGGFRFLQEKRPLIPGSRGGYGWAQWTGPRRRAYEKFCSKHDLDPASDDANYRYLCIELRTTESKAIPALKKARGLKNKVIAFEKNFERAHKDYKHYDSRVEYAETALEAYRERQDVPQEPDLEPVPLPKPRPAEAMFTDRETVELVQERLRDLGYFVTGNPDGNLSTWTEDAIMIYRRARGLPLGTHIDAELIAELKKEQDPRPVSIERKTADMRDVADKIPSIRASARAKIKAIWAMVITAVGYAFSWVVETSKDVWEAVQPAFKLLGQVPLTIWFMLAGGLFALWWFDSKKAVDEGTQEYRKGRIL